MGLKTGEQVSARFCSMTKFRLNPALTFYIYIYESADEFLLRCAGGTCEKKAVCAYWKLLILIIIPGASRAESGKHGFLLALLTAR